MRSLVACLSLAVLAAAPAARAAESYDACTGFITSLPATISTQGVWCLNSDLATAVASGAAITIANNNVTIDCNGFKLGGLGAGNTSTAVGIFADARLNATVRNCNIRGFRVGVQLIGGGHVVEDSRFESNLFVGVEVNGEGGVIRRNQVMDTGGALFEGVGSSAGILATQADVLDNIVDGVTSNGTGQFPFGIVANGMGARVERNSVRRVVTLVPEGYSTGISAGGPGATIRDNSVANLVGTTGGGPQSGISTQSGALSFCYDNGVYGYSTPYVRCQDGGGNLAQ